MALNIPDLTGLSTPASDDLLLIYDVSEPSGSAGKKITRANLLSGVAFGGGNHNFGTSSITSLTAGVASLTFGSTASLTNLLRGSGDVAVSTLGAGSAETRTITVTGALTTDFLLGVAFTAALPDGLLHQAWISGANTVSIRFYNSTAASITGATYTARAVALRFA